MSMYRLGETYVYEMPATSDTLLFSINNELINSIKIYL
jgi:hypothetical protein